MASSERPSYDDLLAAEPPGSSWAVWADEGLELGALNLQTPPRIAAAASGVRRGAVFSLNLAVDAFDPPLFNRAPVHHRLTNGYGALHHDDVLDGFNTQGSSQWDGFRHVRHHAYGWYGGVPEEAHGVAIWGRRGIAGRGVLIDVSRHRPWVVEDPTEPTPITPADLDDVLEREGTSVEEGDVLCLRTGWLGWYRQADRQARAAIAAATTCAGLAPGHEMLRWLWDHGVAAVVADNPTVELWPVGSAATEDERRRVEADPRLVGELSLHRSAVPLLGIPLGELLDFDALSDDCDADGRYDFLFVAAPMVLPGGAASPANALAIK